MPNRPSGSSKASYQSPPAWSRESLGDVADDELDGPAARGASSGSSARCSVAAVCVLAREQAGVVEREPGAAADLLGQFELARRVLAPRLGPDERHRAQRAAAGGERDDHHRVHLQLAHELDLLLVERGGLEQRGSITG